MKYCHRCLQPDTRPNTQFRDDGLCPACHYYDRLQEVDWQERFEILQDLIAQFRAAKVNSTTALLVLVVVRTAPAKLYGCDKLGLNPLLVCLTYPPEQVTERGVTNLSPCRAWLRCTHSGTSAGDLAPTCSRCFSSLYELVPFSTELALFSTVPRLAIHYKIPLILWGENPGLQLGDLKTLGRTGYDGNNLRFMNTLSGGGLDWMLEEGFVEKDLIAYRYPDAEEFDAAGLQIVYLGWFLGDWSLVNNGLYSCASGLQIRDDIAENTGDLYGVSALDEDWVTLNQMIKYYKFGFGRATDYVNEEIRLGRMTRDEGIAVVERYDGCCGPDYISSFCEYIGIDVEQFWHQVHANLNRELFDLEADGTITRRFQVGVGL